MSIQTLNVLYGKSEIWKGLHLVLEHIEKNTLKRKWRRRIEVQPINDQVDDWLLKLTDYSNWQIWSYATNAKKIWMNYM